MTPGCCVQHAATATSCCCADIAMTGRPCGSLVRSHLSRMPKQVAKSNLGALRCLQSSGSMPQMVDALVQLTQTCLLPPWRVAAFAIAASVLKCASRKLSAGSCLQSSGWVAATRLICTWTPEEERGAALGQLSFASRVSAAWCFMLRLVADQFLQPGQGVARRRQAACHTDALPAFCHTCLLTGLSCQPRYICPQLNNVVISLYALSLLIRRDGNEYRACHPQMLHRLWW